MKIVSALLEKLSVLGYEKFYYAQSSATTWRILKPYSAHDSTSYVTVMGPKERHIIQLLLAKFTEVGILLLQYFF